MKTFKIQSFLNLNNHETVVRVQGTDYRLPSYKNTPRAKYKTMNIDDVCFVVTTTEVINLPLPLKEELNYVVSREVLRATHVLEKKILEIPGLINVFKEAGLKNPGDVFEKIRWITRNTLDQRWPKLAEFLKASEHSDLFMDIKKYVGREDLFAPGEKIQEEGKTVACKGLIKVIDKKEILW